MICATWAMIDGPGPSARHRNQAEHAIIAAVKSSELQARFAQMGLISLTSTPEEAAATLKADHARWGGVVKKLGLQVN